MTATEQPSVAEQLAAYKASVDARYARGYTPPKTKAQLRAEERAEDRKQPDWLLIRPDGVMDGWHVFERKRWGTVEDVWKQFFPRKREREQYQRDGWVVRRDADVSSGTPDAEGAS